MFAFVRVALVMVSLHPYHLLSTSLRRIAFLYLMLLLCSNLVTDLLITRGLKF
jgi:hypothetical protein